MFKLYKANIINTFNKLAGFLNQFNIKERMVILLFSIIIIVSLWYILVFLGVNYYISNYNDSLKVMQEKNQEYTQDINRIKSIIAKPDTKQKIGELKTQQKQVYDINSKLRNYQYSTLDQKGITKVLYDFLSQIKDIRILKFSNITQEKYFAEKFRQILEEKKQANIISAKNKTKNKPKPQESSYDLTNKSEEEESINNKSNESDVDEKEVENQEKIETLINKISLTDITDITDVSEILGLLELSDSNEFFYRLPNIQSLTRQDYVLKVEGKYLDIYNLLQNIEEKQQKIFWYKIDYKVKKYPIAEADIYFYILKQKVDN